jgi:glycine betaine/proline transport system ATP-binding protein
MLTGDFNIKQEKKIEVRNLTKIFGKKPKKALSLIEPDT